jgi:glucose/arabinose dehydrogenase
MISAWLRKKWWMWPCVQAAILCAALTPGLLRAAPPAVALQRIVPDESLERPVYLAELPDGRGELVVVEQDGVIKRVIPGHAKAEGIFLDLRSEVSHAGNEEGLLSIAIHPHFAQNHTFFIYYSAVSGARHTVVASMTYDPTRRAADPASEHILLEVPQPFSNHKGGQLVFGPDGYLYVGLGDGGSGGDPYGNGQNRNVLLAKILRLDVDHLSAGLAYGIPADNPFATGGGRPEIFAYGLRNPWRFSFDRATGRLFVGDVGQDAVEEVDIVTRGGNYGWNIMEGTQCYRPDRNCPTAGLLLPIAEYRHDEGNAVTGGYVYRGSALPGLQGHYLFGDFGAGTVWTIPAQDQPGLRTRTLLLKSGLLLSSFGEDSHGELYLLDLKGGVYRLVPAS